MPCDEEQAIQNPANPTTGDETAVSSAVSVPLIRDAVVQAAVQAGDGDLVAYLARQAEKHPSAFLTLLGKVLATQVTGVDGNIVKTRIVFEIVDPIEKEV